MSTEQPGHHEPPIFFFVNGNRIETTQTHLSGEAIKRAAQAVDPSIDISHELVLEASGEGQDTLIPDGQQVDLTHGHGQGPKHFFTRPPTNFGTV